MAMGFSKYSLTCQFCIGCFSGAGAFNAHASSSRDNENSEEIGQVHETKTKDYLPSISLKSQAREKFQNTHLKGRRSVAHAGNEKLHGTFLGYNCARSLGTSLSECRKSEMTCVRTCVKA
jgi:hypothetical protein